MTAIAAIGDAGAVLGTPRSGDTLIVQVLGVVGLGEEVPALGEQAEVLDQKGDDRTDRKSKLP